MKKTLIIGASSNAERYAHRAAIQLMQHGHEIIQLGKKQGQVNGNIIYTSWPEMEHVDTITLYINPLLQKNYYELILLLNPKRIIFNPGTENRELENNEINIAITIPAYFHDLQRNQLKRGVEDAGFKIFKIFSEPTAAAIYYIKNYYKARKYL